MKIVWRVNNMDDSNFKDIVFEWLDKHFGKVGSDVEDVVESETKLVKSVDSEKRMALFVVSEPDVYDLHNTSYTKEEIEKACNNFNTHCNQAAVYHAIDIEKAYIVQSFITPVDFEIEDGRLIKSGTWLQWWKFPEDAEGDLLWGKVKAGEINGVSINAKARIRYEED